MKYYSDLLADGQNRIFVTIPRVQHGIPITLGTFLANSSTGIGTISNPIIKPYPNYDWHKSSGGDCDGITSVYRVMVRLSPIENSSESICKMWPFK